MKLKSTILSMALTCLPLFSIATELQVEHIANAGVKISSGGKSVLIDALFGPHPHFNYLDEDEFGQLSQQGADLALSTHDHSDHFGATRVSQFLSSNPNTLFIGTPSMLESVGKTTPKSQLATALLDNFQSKVFEHNGIKVVALDFPHMEPRPGQAKNFGYLVQIEGWTVLHVGDADVNRQVISKLKLANYNIDLALIHDLFPSRHADYKQLLQLMNTKHLAFVHMTDDKAEPLAKWIQENLPQARMLVTGYEQFSITR